MQIKMDNQKMRTRRILIPVWLFVFVAFFSLVNAQQKLINTSHLDYLYEEISADGNKFGIIHIYCEYPDYKLVGDSDEGIACVDDVARAAIFYMNYSRQYKDSLAVHKAAKLIEFILHMQAENGFFNNFIFQDYSINKTHQNSAAQANWWSWRALWSLTEAYSFFEKSDKEFAGRIKSSIERIITAIKKHFQYEKTFIDLNGFKRPTWLPNQYASDQAALIVITMCKYKTLFGDDSVLNIINDFCEGIMVMQEGSKKEFPFYAFMSWENIWHAWGNSQAYSLLCAYEVTGNKHYLNSAVNEINHFYKYLLQEKFCNEFSIKKGKNKIVSDGGKKYSQIAYGIRPMVYSSLKAAELTGDKRYSLLAAKLASWFFGNNPAKAKMYFEETGICFDGIVNEKEVNKNSGAESTIEALLTLLSIQGDSIASRKLNEIINQKGQLK
jgi:hypothetical protein